MITVTPVYATSICISKSVHDAALPSPAYPYVDYHRSAEVHRVSHIPGPWRVATEGVFGDSTRVMLSGHDTGMCIPHISPIMDNLLLPMTLLNSSCAWPFVSFRKQAEGKGLLGFFPLLAPFIYCDASPDDEQADKDGKSGNKDGKASDEGGKVVKISSDKHQQAKSEHKPYEIGWLWTSKRPLRPSDALGLLPSTPGVRHMQNQLASDRADLQKLGAKLGVQVKGSGRICIPTANTISLQFSLAEFLMGWARLLMKKGFQAALGAMFAPLKWGGTDHLKRLDPGTAKRCAESALTKASWASFKTAGKAVYGPALKATVWKVLYEGVGRSMVLDGKLSAPYGLFSLSLHEEKGHFLVWDIEGELHPNPFKGFHGMADEGLKSLYNPAVEDITKDNPNYAAAPKEDSR
jgi:hypothetical protein